MSVTVSMVPFFLIAASGAAITEIVSAAAVASVNNEKVNYAGPTSLLHLEAEELEDIFNKKFETTILDKDVLLKTLKEHGATKIQINKDAITCDCECFRLTFEKAESDKAYSMQITYYDDKNINEFVKDISSEYTANAQEISYNKIKERLTEKNLEIYEEEIYEDNTIVLTVNLD